MTQLQLDLSPIEEVHHNPGETIDTRFHRFHEANPQVYESLVKLARHMKARGSKKVGIGMLFEVMRWQYAIQTTDADGYKLNNIYRSRYARLMMEQEADLAGVFETRKLESEKVS